MLLEDFSEVDSEVYETFNTCNTAIPKSPTLCSCAQVISPAPVTGHRIFYLHATEELGL
jgi:hypothetical protein